MASVLYALCWITCSGSGQLTHCEDALVSLWRGPCGEELRLPANCYRNELSWEQILQPQSSLQLTEALAKNLKNPEPEPSSSTSCSLISNLQKLCEIINATVYSEYRQPYCIIIKLTKRLELKYSNH